MTGVINVHFDIGSTSFIRSLLMDIHIRIIEFHVFEANISFLLCFEDMNKLNFHFNKPKNVVIISTISIPIIWCFHHSFLFGNKSLHSFEANLFNNDPYFLTDIKPYQLPCRFKHLFAKKVISDIRILWIWDGYKDHQSFWKILYVLSKL